MSKRRKKQISTSVPGCSPWQESFRSQPRMERKRNESPESVHSAETHPDHHADQQHRPSPLLGQFPYLRSYLVSTFANRGSDNPGRDYRVKQPGAKALQG